MTSINNDQEQQLNQGPHLELEAPQHHNFLRPEASSNVKSLKQEFINHDDFNNNVEH